MAKSCKDELWGVRPEMRLACTWDFIQINDDYYITKEDSYKTAIENIAKEHEVHCFVISETLNCVREHNKVYYHHGTSIPNLMCQLVNFDPHLVIMSCFGMPFNKEICKQLPNSRKLLLFVGGKIRIPTEDVDWILMSSEEMRQELANLGYPLKKIINCSFGVNPELFEPSPNQKKLFDVIYCADWRQNKRQELLLRVMAKIPDLRCVFVGAQDSIHNKEYFAQMLKLAKELNILDRMYCVNRIPGSCLPIWYQSSKIGIHLGLPTEGGARSPLEAMSCELPMVVTTDCMSNTSRIAENREGIFAEANPDSLAEKIKILLNDEKIRKSMGKAARERVIKDYHEKRMEDVYRKCLESSMKKKAKEKKRIYLFGYFGYGALADEIIRESTERLIKRIRPDVEVHSVIDAQLYPSSKVEGSSDIGVVTDKLNADYDMVLFCGGTWLGKIRVQYARRVNEWIKKLKIPYVLFGPGWRGENQLRLSPEENEKLHMLIENAYAVGVRGNNTYRELQSQKFDMQNIRIIGDPAFSLQFDEDDEKETNRFIKERDFIGVNARIILPEEIEQAKCHNDWVRWKWLADIFELILNTGDGYSSILNFPLSVPSKMFYSDQKAFHSLKYDLSISKINECYINLIPMARAIGNGKFNIGERLHFQLISLVNNVMFLPMEYEFGKLKDALSINPAFDILRNNIIDMSSDKELPGKDEVLEIYQKIKSINRQEMKSCLIGIKNKQEEWLSNILKQVLG